MSDSYITIVPTNVTQGEVNELSQRTISWLTKREIISGNLTDCVLGQETGYPPGPNYESIITGDDFGLPRLKTNGFAVVTGRRVFDNGGNGLEEITCPKCGGNNIDTNWGEKLEAWLVEQNDKFMCIQCNNDLPITAYDFKPAWGFGELGFTFWNWPGLTLEFLENMKKLLDKDIRVIYGKL